MTSTLITKLIFKHLQNNWAKYDIRAIALYPEDAMTAIKDFVDYYEDRYGVFPDLTQTVLDETCYQIIQYLISKETYFEEMADRLDTAIQESEDSERDRLEEKRFLDYANRYESIEESIQKDIYCDCVKRYEERTGKKYKDFTIIDHNIVNDEVSHLINFYCGHADYNQLV